MLEEFLAEDPNDSFSRYALALEMEKAGEEPAAIAGLEKVIALDPKYVAAYYHLGRLLVKNGRAEQARSVYTQGLTVSAEAGDQRTHSEIQDAIDSL